MQALAWATRYPGAHPPRAGDRRGAEPVRAEHRVQRGRAAGDPHRPGFSRRPLRGAGHEAAARPRRRADDRPHHLPVRRADGGEVRPRAARRAQVLVRAGVPDRVVPAPPGREVRRVLRREHLPAHHQGARLLRSGASRPAATSRRRSRRRRAGSSSSRSPPTGGSPRRARARSSRRWSTTTATSRTRRSSRRTGTTRSCSTTRSTWRSCARTSSASPRNAQPSPAPIRGAAREARATGPASVPAPYVPSAAAAAGRADFATIAAWIARGSHVLDLGCGDGSLLAYLARERGATGYGIEIDDAGVLASVAQRHQRAAERPRVGPRRLRRRVVRLRDPVADAAGDAAHRGDRRRDAARRARGDRHVPELRPLVASLADRCRAACRSRRRCPTSGTTRRTSTCARSPTSTRSWRERRLPVDEPRRARRRPAGGVPAQSHGRARDLPVPARMIPPRAGCGRAVAPPIRLESRDDRSRPRARFALHDPAAASNKLFWVGLLYFAEGYPLGVFYEIFPVYFRQQGVELRQIGVLSLLGLAWTLKFLWAPAIDYWRHHRRWMAAVDVAMGVRDAVLRDAGRLRPDGLGGDRRVHRAVGDERRRDRRLHDRVSRAGRARARQRHPDRPVSRRHARVRASC